MTNVFILNNIGHDYSEAEKYGELRTATAGNLPIFYTTQMINILKNGLEDFDKEDFLLLSGPAVVGAMATQLILSRFDSVKVLIYDAKNQSYVARHISKNQYTFNG